MSLRVAVVAGLALALLADCRSEREGWRTHYPKPLDRQTDGVAGRPCEVGSSSRACDPFICHRGTCRVEACEGERDCKHGGSCVEGYCALPPPQPGKKCEPFDEDIDEDDAKRFAEYDECRCRPEYWSENTTYSAAAECGPFPCTPNGCYVRSCDDDGDCAAGVCASHTGWPDGWCVVADDY